VISVNFGYINPNALAYLPNSLNFFAFLTLIIWHCPICINTVLPFPIDTKSSPDTSNISPDTNLNDDLKTLLADLNNVVTGLTTSGDNEEDELEIQFHSNSCILTVMNLIL